MRIRNGTIRHWIYLATLPFNRGLRPFLNNLLLLIALLVDSSERVNGVSKLEKTRLFLRIISNFRRIDSKTTLIQHLMLANTIISTPASLEGAVVECGCYNGSSTISLSLACELASRRLIVCDSFEGLPKPRKVEKYKDDITAKAFSEWEEGAYSSEGGLESVKRSIRMYGNIDVCTFEKGLFSKTLENINTKSIVMVFEDADLRGSVEDCVRYLWPKLQKGCRFYSHEPWSIQVIALFYDHNWWRENLGLEPPGFFGSGHGLRAGITETRMGYSVKSCATVNAL